MKKLLLLITMIASLNSFARTELQCLQSSMNHTMLAKVIIEDETGLSKIGLVLNEYIDGQEDCLAQIEEGVDHLAPVQATGIRTSKECIHPLNTTAYLFVDSWIDEGTGLTHSFHVINEFDNLADCENFAEDNQ